MRLPRHAGYMISPPLFRRCGHALTLLLWWWYWDSEIFGGNQRRVGREVGPEGKTTVTTNKKWVYTIKEAVRGCNQGGGVGVLYQGGGTGVLCQGGGVGVLQGDGTGALLQGGGTGVLVQGGGTCDTIGVHQQ